MNVDPVGLARKPLLNLCRRIRRLKFANHGPRDINRALEGLQQFITVDQDQRRSSKKDSIYFRSITLKIGFVVFQESKVFLKECFTFAEGQPSRFFATWPRLNAPER
jgi:hypothetical protein